MDLVLHQQPGLTVEVLLERRRHLPAVDATRFREDVDEVLDARL